MADKMRTKKKRFDPDSQTTSKTTHWTLKERNSLTEAVKKYGTSDLQKISDFIGTRTVADVGQKLCQHRHQMKVSQQTAESSQSPNIHLWYELARSSIDKYNRSKDFSTALADVMQTLTADDVVDPNEEVDFNQIYLYLQNIFLGSVPPIPGPAESLIIINLIKELSQILKQNSFEEEKEFLKNLDKRPVQPVPDEFRVNTRFLSNLGRIKTRQRNLRKKFMPRKKHNKISPSDAESGEQPNEQECAANGAAENGSEPTPSTSRTDNSLETDNADQNGTATGQLSEYPVCSVNLHTYKMLAYTTNPLQIHTKFLTKSRDFMNTY